MVGGSAQAAVPTLQAVVGVNEKFTITLKKPNGTTVRSLRAGTYRIRVRDASKIHDFRLRGPGVTKRTGIGEVVTRTWTVTFKPGTYTYFCTPHAFSMAGSFKVVA